MTCTGVGAPWVCRGSYRTGRGSASGSGRFGTAQLRPSHALVVVQVLIDDEPRPQLASPADGHPSHDRRPGVLGRRISEGASSTFMSGRVHGGAGGVTLARMVWPGAGRAPTCRACGQQPEP